GVAVRRRDGRSAMKRTTGQLTLIVAAICAVIFFAFMAIRPAGAGETPIYGPDGKYQGSVFNYGKTQTYTDRNGHFTGSAVNNGTGTTSFFNRNGSFIGSAGSSIDRTFNFGRTQ